MLTTLFSSPVRVKILKVLVMQSSSSFTAADIALRTGIIVRSINKEIGKLVEVGAVAEEVCPREINHKVVKIKHYRAQPDFFLFDEIKQLFIKLQIFDLNDLTNKLRTTGNINYAVLTGKFVNNSQSPIDMLLVGKINNNKLQKVVAAFEQKTGWEVNWSAMTLEDYDYRRQIGDIFLQDLLSGKKLEIIKAFV